MLHLQCSIHYPTESLPCGQMYVTLLPTLILSSEHGSWKDWTCSRELFSPISFHTRGRYCWLMWPSLGRLTASSDYASWLAGLCKGLLVDNCKSWHPRGSLCSTLAVFQPGACTRSAYQALLTNLLCLQPCRRDTRDRAHSGQTAVHAAVYLKGASGLCEL